MLYNLDAIERTNWCTHAKCMLFRYGFGCVWFEQGVGDIKTFLSEFKQRLVDCAAQDWHADVSNSSKLYSYSLFKTQLNFEKYLTYKV